MAVSESYRSFILERLEVVGEITSRKMFGGVGVYCGGYFFALLDDDSLYFKVDDSNRGDFEHFGMCPFRPYKDDLHVMQYYEVPADVIEDDTTLREWGQKAVAVAQQAKRKNQKKKR